MSILKAADLHTRQSLEFKRTDLALSSLGESVSTVSYSWLTGEKSDAIFCCCGSFRLHGLTRDAFLSVALVKRDCLSYRGLPGTTRCLTILPGLLTSARCLHSQNSCSLGAFFLFPCESRETCSI